MNIEPRAVPPSLRGSAAITVDLEDWHQLLARRATGILPPPSERVLYQTDKVLALLDAHGAKATFYVLGTVAERFPAMVRRIQEQGHEVASHGYGHVPLHLLTIAAARNDLKRAAGLLSDIIGERVLGYRAPEFSVTSRNLQVLEAIADAGFEYDSSIFPIRHRRYGIPAFPRDVCKVHLDSGRSLWELPLATVRLAGTNLPVAGGGYFRLLPGGLLRRAIKRVVREPRLPVLYVHPYEFDDAELGTNAAPPGIAGRKLRLWLQAQRLGRRKLPSKLAPILGSLTFVRCRDVVSALVAQEEWARGNGREGCRQHSDYGHTGNAGPRHLMRSTIPTALRRAR